MQVPELAPGSEILLSTDLEVGDFFLERLCCDQPVAHGHTGLP